MSFCIVVVMNKHMVNGSPNEQQEIKSTDSKTGNTGKYIIKYFLSRFILITSSEYYTLCWYDSLSLPLYNELPVYLDAITTACDALANEGRRITLVKNGWRQLQQFGKKWVRDCYELIFSCMIITIHCY